MTVIYSTFGSWLDHFDRCPARVPAPGKRRGDEGAARRLALVLPSHHGWDLALQEHHEQVRGPDPNGAALL